MLRDARDNMAFSLVPRKPMIEQRLGHQPEAGVFSDARSRGAAERGFEAGDGQARAGAHQGQVTRGSQCAHADAGPQS